MVIQPMALTSTMLRFVIDLSDVDRGKYEKIELRVARHPSESSPYLLARVIAYCLNLTEGIAFTGGIDSPDEPAIWVRNLTGTLLMWIDVGNPSAKRLHKASKAAKQVRVYTYRDPKILLDEIASEKVHRSESIELFALSPAFVSDLEQTLARDNTWQVLYTDGELSITANGQSLATELVAFSGQSSR